MDVLPISTPHCRVERDGHVVIVTMDRQEARNALSSDMLVGLASAWAYVSEQPEVRVAILTGAGGTFCAGADLKAMGTPSTDPEVQARAAAIANFHWKGLLREDLPTKPIICAVEGYAVAGGTELLVGTDLRVVGESATLGLFEAKRALFPMGGSAIRLPRQIPYCHAMDLLLTGRSVTAAEALAMGAGEQGRPRRAGAGGGARARRRRRGLGAAGRTGDPAHLPRHPRTGRAGGAQGLRRVRLAGDRLRGRQGGGEGLQGEAPRPLPGPLMA
ncbi:hypothetical protein GCM10020219_016720 [Nonomuraea dietziae]